MIQTLIRNWWLVALCGAAELFYSPGILRMRDPAGISTIIFLGKFALAAGICAIAAGVWRSAKGKPWLLVLNGLALAIFGLLSIFFSRRRLSFTPVALLFVVMTVSIGVLALRTAPALRRQLPDRWLLTARGVVWMLFAVAFVAMAFRLIRFEQPGAYFVWNSFYFAFSAACMLGLALRLQSLSASIHRMARLA